MSLPTTMPLVIVDSVAAEKSAYARSRNTRYWATELRKKGYLIYSIGLGNPFAASEDEKGIVSATQPKGELMFAPSKAA